MAVGGVAPWVTRGAHRSRALFRWPTFIATRGRRRPHKPPSGTMLETVIYIVGGIALILAVCCFAYCVLLRLSRRGGWAVLANSYACQRPPVGVTRNMQTVEIGRVKYRSCLTVRVSADGLYLALWPFVFAGHPPLLIPWSHLRETGGSGSSGFWHFVEVAVESLPITRIRLPVRILEVAEGAGYWPLNCLHKE